MAFRSKTGPNSIIGGNLPIFGKTPIVVAAGFAPTGHDLHDVEAVMAMTAPACKRCHARSRRRADFRRESEKMSRYLLKVVIVSSFASIFQETIEYIGGWHSTPLCAVSYFRA